jgi:ribosomal protein L11 methyltransferase
MVDKTARVNDYGSMSNDNHPHQPLWGVRLNFQKILSGNLPEKIAAALEDIAASVFLHNQESTDGDNWTVSLTTQGAPDVGDILRRVNLVASNENLPPLLHTEDVVVERLPEKDWLQYVHENFPPLQAGRFFIYGSHYSGEKPQNLTPLQIDAATAFGSGEHETTRGCLLALEFLKQQHEECTGALDMGCGSGILAIALIKLWPVAKVTAVDIDPESVIVTQRHAAMNDVSGKIIAAAGDGYNTSLAEQNAPYDIVTANILANPLIDMAPALAAVLKPGGYAILSGLLTRQKADVLVAHEKQGLRLVQGWEIGEWQALLLRK